MFGSEESLAEELRFPVFVQSLSPEGMDAQRALRKGLPLEAMTYISEFEARLPDNVRDDPRYEYRIQLQPIIGPKSEADLAFKFINAKDLSPEELEEKHSEGRQGKILIIEKLKASGFADEMLPKNAAAAIEEQTKFRFSVNDFTKMRHRDGVGPKKGHGPSAEYADGSRCIYSKAHNSHVYTQAYIAAMIQELRDPARHEAALGRAPEVPGSPPYPKQHPLAKQKK